MLDLLSACIDQHSQTYIWTVHECTLSLSVIHVFDFRKNKLWAQRSMCEFRFSKDTFAHKCTSINTSSNVSFEMQRNSSSQTMSYPFIILYANKSVQWVRFNIYILSSSFFWGGGVSKSNHIVHQGSISKCTFISNGPNMINSYENSYYVIVDQMILVIKELFNDNFTVYFVSSGQLAITKDIFVHNPSEICRLHTKIDQFNKSENLLLQTSM